MKIDNGKKKIIIKYLGIVVLYILACVFWLKSGILDTCFFYNSVDKGRWEYGYNAVMRKAFVGIYRWDGNTENMTIKIPYTYKNAKVFELGGYTGKGAPSKFGVVLPKEYYKNVDGVADGDWNIDKNDEYETLKFKVILTENIEELNNTFSKEYYLQYTDGEYDDVLYKVEYYYECPKRNKTFYSKNGKLYYKSNNKLAIKN